MAPTPMIELTPCNRQKLRIPKKHSWADSELHWQTGQEMFFTGPRWSPTIGLQLLDWTIRLEAVASRLEAVASRLEAIPMRLETVASRLEAITIRLEANIIR